MAIQSEHGKVPHRQAFTFSGKEGANSVLEPPVTFDTSSQLGGKDLGPPALVRVDQVKNTKWFWHRAVGTFARLGFRMLGFRMIGFKMIGFKLSGLHPSKISSYPGSADTTPPTA
jgi:hypothetical protein